VATFTQLGSGNWRVKARRETCYVAETFRRRKDGEEWRSKWSVTAMNRPRHAPCGTFARLAN
jgi:hypothetical protein